MNILGVYGAWGWNPRNEDHIKNDIEQHLVEWVHDAGASLFIDGEHICSIQEERLSRVKYDGSEPQQSIMYCLEAGKLTVDMIDMVCVATPGSPLFKISRFEHQLQKRLEGLFPKAKIEFYPHHSCHAAVSIYTSPYEEGAFITNDGSGESIPSHVARDDEGRFVFPTSITERGALGYFNKNKSMFRIFHDLPHTNCLGSHWAIGSESIFCSIIDIEHNTGKHYRGEMDSMHGKIMGLCAYGSDLGKDPDFEKKYIYTITNEEIGYNGRPYIGEHHPHWSSEECTTLSHAEKAYVLQRNHEDALQKMMTLYYKEGYLEDNVCFSGGIFLNVKANTWLKQTPMMKGVHIPPYTTDTGLHLGAAFLGLVSQGCKHPTMPDNIALLGKHYNSNEIEEAIKEFNRSTENSLFYEHRPFDIDNIAAECINDNKIVGWFQGRSEFGPRALGSRSILMSPKLAENKDILNQRVKHREEWRPFAGIILDEYLTDYFEEDFESPYMLYAFTVKEDKVSEIPAISHLDRSCRIQTVNEEQNHTVTKLLRAVNEKTGVPIVLNTSFNDNGEPIVETPTDALNAFMKMDIDILFMGNYVVRKND
jgi:carbamoyltransferase